MAAKHPVRSRAVSGTSMRGSAPEELKWLLHALNKVDKGSFHAVQETLHQSECLLKLRHTLLDRDAQKETQDAFRKQKGFQTLLKAICTLCDLGEDEKLDTVHDDLLILFKQGLSVVTAALRDHGGNQRFFRSRLVPSGWNDLEKAIILLGNRFSNEIQGWSAIEDLFGILFAAAVADETLTDLYKNVRKPSSDEDGTKGITPEQHMDNLKERLRALEADVSDLTHPELLSVMVNLWVSLPIQPNGFIRDTLKITLPFSILEVASKSKRNIVDAHIAGVFKATVRLLFAPDNVPLDSNGFQDLALLLAQQGISDLGDAKLVWSHAAKDRTAASFLLNALYASRQPPVIQFDLSRHGHCSLEIASLGGNFPPQDTNGYSLFVWARFDNFDDTAHTTLFGAFDATQTCFVLMYLEKDTRNLILQTSIRGPKPSVRFKSTTFEPGRWYHIGVTHRRPRTTTPARASLFVDGEFVEQIKATYPSAPPNTKMSGVVKTQAFYGTPQDLSPSTSNGFKSSLWSLASSLLYGDIISDDLISVIYHLGPRYYGNFQDCLGSFQTYQASADLNLRNENLHPGKEDHSEIILAIRHKASQLFKESSILINISPNMVLDSDERNYIDESQLIKSLSKNAAHNLYQYTRSGGNAIAVNGAIPAINDALSHIHGIGILTGDPVVAVPRPFDDTAWSLGGCASLGLNLIHIARNTEDVACAAEILIESVRHNWRNSEIMERDQGYAIFASLLKHKLGTAETGKDFASIPTPSLDRDGLALRLLQKVLSFLGFDFQQPECSIINNPLAYRVLMIDSNVWRSASQEVQELYFKQFLVFGRDSRHHRFNLRRLTRMRVFKRLLEALKSENVTSTAMQMHNLTFAMLLPSAASAETLRSLALFVTYAVHRGHFTLQTRKSLRKETRPRNLSTSTSSSNPDVSRGLSHFEIGVETLRFYTDFLCANDDGSLIKKFAKTVTNKWLLYLMSESTPEVVVLSTRILARLLVTHGDVYVKKFKDKSGGFAVMRHRLKRWWHIPAIWPICFAILFNLDVATLNLDRPFDLFGLVELFSSKGHLKVVYPEMFEVIMGMLQTGLKTIAHTQPALISDQLSPEPGLENSHTPQRLSMSSMAPPDPSVTTVAPSHIETFNTVLGFLADLHERSQNYRDFAASSSYIQELLHVLFPVVVGSDSVDASTELNARDSMLTFDGHDVIVQPLSKAPSVIRTAETETASGLERTSGLIRGSSFILVTSEDARQEPANSHLKRSTVSSISPVAKPPRLNEGSAAVQSCLEIVVSVFCDQILNRKDFPGLGLFLRTPPGFIEHQSYFESWVLRNTLSHLSNAILLNQKFLWEPKVLTNLARLFSHLGEAVFEGWFVGGAIPSLDLAGSVLEYLQRPDIAKVKSVRLCSQAISNIRTVVFRIVLLSLSEVQPESTLEFLEKLAYWQTVLLSAEERKSNYLELICYLLYTHLTSDVEAVKMAAINLWRIILVQRPDEANAILSHATSSEHRQLVAGFGKLIEIDNETFMVWIQENRRQLDSLFFDTLSKSWEQFVVEENKKTEETSLQRISRRREKLKQWAQDDEARDEIIRRHEVTFDHWTSNIYSSESLKHQRIMQDQHDDRMFTDSVFARMQREAKRPPGFLEASAPQKWRLDQTEGRNRMRLRILEDFSKLQDGEQPRRKGSEMPLLKLDTRNVQLSSADSIGMTPGFDTPPVESPKRINTGTEAFPVLAEDGEVQREVEQDEGFELIVDPNEGIDNFEDKNRKVMRSLHHGDQVKQVANVSRIVGLEAVEGLLILGKDYLYIIDNFFQRIDGEIVNVSQAPQDERDPYVRMISGRDVVTRKPTPNGEEHETRSWKWSNIISVSKRRFLFRDVSLEIFFADGQSYLLTIASKQGRDELHSLISAKAPQGSGSSSNNLDFAWRLETLKSVDDEPQTLGSRFANVFGQTPTLAATKKWQKGEMSNFHYLMLVNTLAGRTFNDLTQYPVFPWIIADYTSEELDLTNPKTFRDLTKPMGCQIPAREAEFRERYKSFAEMGDHNSPPFHYGTHYSSAMIVSSYLIRLQPFVKSFLLLQGGSFDHPERMFFSIERAWKSASHQNMTDVRELTPEFFYLPEFLVNINGYDFGTRQNTNEPIWDVELPPWAKGDPKIFIAKQREALESPFVSQHLHAWIDLIFGFKQKGEPAFEAVNVFHHLSYQGAKDLDNIADPVERLATIGIIHNFGQTPYQLFSRPHPSREATKHQYKRLDSAAESLTKLPFTLLDSGERIASLCFSWKQERLLCSGPFRINIPPHYDKYMEWGFVDSSVRFYSSDNRQQIGLFEHLHIGQLCCAEFVDSTTLVTAGLDCTIATWNVVSTSKMVDLQPRATLFGHCAPVNVLAFSRSLSALLSASEDGEICLWDLNRAEFVRKINLSQAIGREMAEDCSIPKGSAIACAHINDVSGDILLCQGSTIFIFTVNADFLLRQDAGDPILSCVAYEGVGSEWLERDIMFTGHKRGVVRVWSKVIRDGRFELECIRQLNHVDQTKEFGGNTDSGISCILAMPQVVYTGDEDGKVVSPSI